MVLLHDIVRNSYWFGKNMASSVLYRLELANMKRTLEAVLEENKMLKASLSRYNYEAAASAKFVIHDEAAQERWAYYHKNKEAVASEISKSLGIEPQMIAWCVVKRKTDQMFEKSQGNPALETVMEEPCSE